MSWENKSISKFSFPVYFSPFTKCFNNSLGKVYAYKNTRHAGYSLCSFLLCGLEGEIMLFSLEQKALLEAEILHQLRELVYRAGLHMTFPEQHKWSEKSLPNGFGGNLIFISDLILQNILHWRFC